MSEETPEYRTDGEAAATWDPLPFATHLKSMIAMLKIFRDCLDAEVLKVVNDDERTLNYRLDLRDAFHQVQDLIWMLQGVS